jgi:hypothetical protein
MTNEEKLGLKVIELLNLKQDRKGLVKTQWGNKTPLGLGYMIMDLAIEFDSKDIVKTELTKLPIGLTEILTK